MQNFTTPPVSSHSDLPQEIEAKIILSALDVGQWTLHGRRNRCFILASGSGSITLGEEETAHVAPCLVWLPAGQSSYLSLKAGSRGGWLATTDQLIGHMALPVNIADDLRHMLTRPLLGVSVPIALARRLVDQIASIEDELRTGNPGAQEIVRHQLATVFISLWRLSELVSRDARALPRLIVDNFLTLLEVHLHDHWRVSDYAREMGVSTDRLNTAVRRALGKTPLEIIHARISAAARQMLEGSGLQIDAISRLLGFEDPAYFSRFYKRLTGMSPRDYRLAYTNQTHREASSFAAWP